MTIARTIDERDYLKDKKESDKQTQLSVQDVLKEED